MADLEVESVASSVFLALTHKPQSVLTTFPSFAITTLGLNQETKIMQCVQHLAHEMTWLRTWIHG